MYLEHSFVNSRNLIGQSEAINHLVPAYVGHLVYLGLLITSYLGPLTHTVRTGREKRAWYLAFAHAPK